MHAYICHVYSVLEQQPGISPWHEGLTVQQKAAEAARYIRILYKTGYWSLLTDHAILQHISFAQLQAKPHQHRGQSDTFDSALVRSQTLLNYY